MTKNEAVERDDVQVDKFPFPTPPQLSGLREAQLCLAALGAVEGASAAITALGCKMAAFPISPRHARLLIQARHFSLYSWFLHSAERVAAADCRWNPCTSADVSTIGRCASKRDWESGACCVQVPILGMSRELASLSLAFIAFLQRMQTQRLAVVIQIAEDVKSRTKCLPLATALTAAMSVETPFVHVDNIQVSQVTSPVSLGQLPAGSSTPCQPVFPAALIVYNPELHSALKLISSQGNLRYLSVEGSLSTATSFSLLKRAPLCEFQWVLGLLLSLVVRLWHTQAGEGGDAESAKKERQRARAAHAQLRDPSSDALSALAALMGFEAAFNPAAFCRYAERLFTGWSDLYFAACRVYKRNGRQAQLAAISVVELRLEDQLIVLTCFIWLTQRYSSAAQF